MQSSRSKNSVLNLISGLGGQFLGILLNFITRTVFVNTFGKEYLGINGLFTDILTMLSLTELGLDTAITYRLYKPLADGDKDRIRTLMKFYRDAYRVVGVVIAAIGICLIPALPTLITDYKTLEELDIDIVFIFLLNLLQSVSSYLFFASYGSIVKADQHEYLLNIYRYAVQLISFTCQMYVMLTGRGFVEYTVTLVAFTIIQNIVNAIIAKKNYPWAFEKTTDHLKINEIKDIFKDLGALFVFRINYVVVKATDNIILSAFIGIAIVGIYSNYQLIVTAIDSILSRFYNSVSASIGNLFVYSDSKTKYHFFESMNLITMILYGTACVGISITANELIKTWIGKEFVITQPFPVLLGVEMLLSGIRLNLNGFRNATGVFRRMWWRPLLGIMVNLIVSILLVNPLGIYGVVLGTIAADFFTFFLIEPYIIHKYCLDDSCNVIFYYGKCLKYMAIIFLAGCADGFICSHLFVGYGWLSVASHILICLVSVPLAFFFFCYKQEEMIYLIRFFKKFVTRIHTVELARRDKDV